MLLLLLLLRFLFRRQVSRPVFRHVHFLFERRQRIGWRHANTHVSSLSICALEDTTRRGYVGVVAANGGPDVAVSGKLIVRGIEADPAKPWKQSLYPRVRRAFARTVLIALPVEQIAAYITARY